MSQGRRTRGSTRFLLLAAGACVLSATLSCSEEERNSAPPASTREDAFRVQRGRMVRHDIAGPFTGAAQVDDERVLEAMRKTLRHRFVPEEFAGRAYADHPLSIGHGQTVSQPYIVALMTQLAEVGKEAVGPVQATQALMVVRKDEEGALTKRSVLPVRFVPFLREEEKD